MSVEKELEKAEGKLKNFLVSAQRIYRFVPIVRDIIDVFVGVYIGIREVVKSAPSRYNEIDRQKYLKEVHKGEEQF